ncbi:hypothetical protein ACLMJK_007660 [Lecanora helva]
MADAPSRYREIHERICSKNIHLGSQDNSPFRFSDLPTEIRRMILSYLLIRGPVIFSQRTSIKSRFPDWQHEPPQWSLLHGVSRQIQTDARAVVFSSANTFFSTVGALYDDELPDTLFHSLLPPVKRLDCVFDMRDVVEDSFSTLQAVRQWHDSHDVSAGVEFDALARGEKLDIIHGYKRSSLMDAWLKKIRTLMKQKFELLRLDLRECRCLLGCCWLFKEMLAHFNYRGYQENHPDRLEIVGAYDEAEAESTKRMIRNHNDESFKTEIVFVDKPGCNCNRYRSCDDDP